MCKISHAITVLTYLQQVWGKVPSKPIIINFLTLDFVKIVTTCSKLNNHFEDSGYSHFHLF